MKKILALATVLISLSASAGSGLSGGGGSIVGPGTGGGTSGTNFAGILVTNTAYASNFVATATGQTNVFDVTLFTNGVTAWTSSIDTNTAAINTSSASVGSYTNTTIYTNAGQRCLLVGSVVIPALSVPGGAGMYIRYTNNAVGYVVPVFIAHGNGASGTTYVPFSIPMSTGSTFKFETNTTGSAAVYVTNVVCWRL